MKNYAYDSFGEFKGDFMSGFDYGPWRDVVYRTKGNKIRIWRLKKHAPKRYIDASDYHLKNGKLCKKARCRVRLKEVNRAPVNIIAYRVVSDHPSIAKRPEALIFPTLEKAIAWAHAAEANFTNT
jgi:hypothetical protein